MPFRHIPYAAQTAPTMSELDDTFADVGAVTVTPCTATGTNTYTLTPIANTASVSAYSNNLRFTFISPNTSTGACQIQVLALGFVNLYLPGGVTQAGQGNIIANVPYDVMYNGTLNANAGGFVIISANANAFGSMGSVSAAGTTTIFGLTTDYIQINGTGTITAFDTAAAGIARTITFTSGVAITNSSNLICPGGQTINTSPGDVAKVTSEGGGVARIGSYMSANQGPSPGVLRNYIDGYTLSNDGLSPSRSLNVAQGECADTTNHVYISNTVSFNKTIGGSWVSGTGNAGLGTGLTLTSSTWYHCFAIINNGLFDVYYDTTSSGANSPANTAVLRRIGSALTNNASSSGQIGFQQFSQMGNSFLWKTTVQDMTSVALTSGSGTLQVLTVPTGVQVDAQFHAELVAGASAGAVSFSSPDENDQTEQAWTADLFQQTAGNAAAGSFTRRTNANAQIRWRGNQTTGTINEGTFGWMDYRGKQ